MLERFTAKSGHDISIKAHPDGMRQITAYTEEHSGGAIDHDPTAALMHAIARAVEAEKREEAGSEETDAPESSPAWWPTKTS